MTVALYAIGGALQLVGVGLVVLDVRQARRRAAQELSDASDLKGSYGGFWNVGLGGTQVQAELAIRHLEYLHRANVAWLRSSALRAGWGAALIIAGIALTTAAGIVSTA